MGAMSFINYEAFCYEIDQIYAICDKERCFYCGKPRESLDHVVPHSYLCNGDTKRTYRTGVLPACKECNSVLSNSMFDTLEERFSYLENKMWFRYRKALESKVVWTDKELLELSSSLRSAVLTKMECQKEAQERLDNLARRPLLSPMRPVGFEIAGLKKLLKAQQKLIKAQEALSKEENIS